MCKYPPSPPLAIAKLHHPGTERGDQRRRKGSLRYRACAGYTSVSIVCVSTNGSANSDTAVVPKLLLPAARPHRTSTKCQAECCTEVSACNSSPHQLCSRCNYHLHAAPYEVVEAQSITSPKVQHLHVTRGLGGQSLALRVLAALSSICLHSSHRALAVLQLRVFILTSQGHTGTEGLCLSHGH